MISDFAIGFVITLACAVAGWFTLLNPKTKPQPPAAQPKPNTSPLHESAAHQRGVASVADDKAASTKADVENALQGSPESLANLFNKDHGEA